MLKKLFGKLAGKEAAAAASTARFVIFLKHCGRLGSCWCEISIEFLYISPISSYLSSLSLWWSLLFRQYPKTSAVATPDSSNAQHHAAAAAAAANAAAAKAAHAAVSNAHAGAAAAAASATAPGGHVGGQGPRTGE